MLVPPVVFVETAAEGLALLLTTALWAMALLLIPRNDIDKKEEKDSPAKRLLRRAKIFMDQKVLMKALTKFEVFISA